MPLQCSTTALPKHPKTHDSCHAPTPQIALHQPTHAFTVTSAPGTSLKPIRSPPSHAAPVPAANAMHCAPARISSQESSTQAAAPTQLEAVHTSVQTRARCRTTTRSGHSGPELSSERNNRKQPIRRSALQLPTVQRASRFIMFRVQLRYHSPKRFLTSDFHVRTRAEPRLLRRRASHAGVRTRKRKPVARTHHHGIDTRRYNSTQPPIGTLRSTPTNHHALPRRTRTPTPGPPRRLGWLGAAAQARRCVCFWAERVGRLSDAPVRCGAAEGGGLGQGCVCVWLWCLGWSGGM
ncbi:hypothetical protein EJ07DRAFT_155416 [Lizonia empirigonia]|nr:hypothetical protein EJ07DRAFT_155416 [Lizonia empirigonia]